MVLKKLMFLFVIVFILSGPWWVLYNCSIQQNSFTERPTDWPSYQLLSSNDSIFTFLYEDQLPADDATRLINLTDFRFLVNTPCSSSLFIVLVHSAPGNLELRNLIRTTWGRHVPVYFFIGITTSFKNQTSLNMEANLYHDLVQGNFNDTYRNLTYKHTMLFKWVVYYCHNIQYVLKIDDDTFVNVIDDDTFVNVWRLKHFLTHTLSLYGAQNLLLCNDLQRNALVFRTYRSKWHVTFSDYPNPYYPPYCSGYFVLYSPDVVFKLYQLLQIHNKFFWVDDAFITGLLPLQLNLTLGELVPFKRYDVWSISNVRSFDPKTTVCALFWESNKTESYITMYNKTLEVELFANSK